MNIPISIPNGIANFVRLVNGYIPEGMKPLSVAQVIQWLRNEGLMQEILKEDGRKIIYISSYDPVCGTGKLEDVTTKEEMQLVKQILSLIDER